MAITLPNGTVLRNLVEEVQFHKEEIEALQNRPEVDTSNLAKLNEPNTFGYPNSFARELNVQGNFIGSREGEAFELDANDKEIRLAGSKATFHSGGAKYIDVIPGEVTTVDFPQGTVDIVSQGVIGLYGTDITFNDEPLAIGDFVEKTSTASIVYGTDGGGNQRVYAVGTSATPDTIVRRIGDKVRTGNPTTDWDAVNLSYLNSRLPKITTGTSAPNDQTVGNPGDIYIQNNLEISNSAFTIFMCAGHPYGSTGSYIWKKIADVMDQ